MKINRASAKNESNNKDNPNKNMCALEVAKVFRVDTMVTYLHTVEDLVSALRKRYTVRSRRSSIKGDTVGQLRNSIAKNGDAIAYLVLVKGHVLVLDQNGKTAVDTDPKKRDRRKVVKIYGIYFK